MVNLKNLTRFSTLLFLFNKLFLAPIGAGKNCLSKFCVFRKYFREKRVSIVVDYVDTRISNCVIEYLRENKKVLKNVLAYSYGALEKYFEPKNRGRKIS